MVGTVMFTKFRHVEYIILHGGNSIFFEFLQSKCFSMLSGIPGVFDHCMKTNEKPTRFRKRVSNPVTLWFLYD